MRSSVACCKMPRPTGFPSCVEENMVDSWRLQHRYSCNKWFFMKFSTAFLIIPATDSLMKFSCGFTVASTVPQFGRWKITPNPQVAWEQLPSYHHQHHLTWPPFAMFKKCDLFYLCCWSESPLSSMFRVAITESPFTNISQHCVTKDPTIAC